MDLLHTVVEKAAFFAGVTDSKKSDKGLTMPQLCIEEVESTRFAFCSGEIKKLLFELDPHGGTGSWYFSFDFYHDCYLFRTDDFYCLPQIG